MAPFDNCWKRIERAEAHREAFGEVWNGLVQRDDAYSPVVRVDDHGTGRIWIEPIHFSGFPPFASLELGEMLYQLRAALDASIYECAILETGKDPPADENSLEFPVCKSPAEFTKAAWKIKPLTGERRRIVESVQPYGIDKLAPNTAVHDRSRNLWMIHDWARKDRHRRLHIVGSWASMSEPVFILPDGVSLISKFVSLPGLLENNSEIANFQLAGWVPSMERDLKVNFNPPLSIDVAIEDVPPKAADNDTTWVRLTCMATTTRAIVHWLQNSFA